MNIPEKVKNLLNNKQLCSMATSWENQPYLSLMNFTYIESENNVVLSSRKNTKKYFNIQKNKNISLLVFSSTDNLSATLLGTAATMNREDKKGNYYKEIHMKKSNMPQFILGDNIALIIFSIEKIIVSDNQDQVEYIN